ncbi:hypothetical protein Ahy_A09g044463 [Arachis hypogaea]|uniref:Uncharacterized protein n=1 Tax=Arachis hypogaea TaxID=3818 RepID=A0A445BK46_ARAHY|nr:hypothetical protein Ahy_A09g044463 [Arachis hypogaea]
MCTKPRFCGSEHHWGHMTTNLVECIKSMLKCAHNLPVTALVRTLFYHLNELFTWKSAEAQEQIIAGHVFSKFASAKLQANLQASGNIQLHRSDR